jgi:cysteine desulfurase
VPDAAGGTVYLDYNATTPVDPAVLEAMLPWFTDRFWNASSSHAQGRRAADAVEQARASLASLLGARPREVIFTSGATEANNLALKGAVAAAPPKRRKVVVAATEHKAILDTADWLHDEGVDVNVVPVLSTGQLDVDAYRGAVDERTALVSVMTANNETGVITRDLDDLVDIAHEAGALFHTDATQAVGKTAFDVTTTGVDLASLSSHKIYGPKGVGGLYIRRGTRVAPLIHGGGHEAGLRSGTLNVPAIVGFGAAAAQCIERCAVDTEAYTALIDLLTQSLAALGDVVVVGAGTQRLANTLMARFVGADAEAVMANAPNIAVSSGSACTSMVPAPSHVLLAMGLDHEAALECVRFSVGRPTTAREIATAVDEVALAVARVRAMGLDPERLNDRSLRRTP